MEEFFIDDASEVHAPRPSQPGGPSLADRLPLHIIVQRLAKHAEKLAQKATSLDETMGGYLVEQGHGDRALTSAVQDVDFIRQMADCVQILLQNLSKHPEMVQYDVEVETLKRGLYLRDMLVACLGPEEFGPEETRPQDGLVCDNPMGG